VPIENQVGKLSGNNSNRYFGRWIRDENGFVIFPIVTAPLPRRTGERVLALGAVVPRVCLRIASNVLSGVSIVRRRACVPKRTKNSGPAKTGLTSAAGSLSRVLYARHGDHTTSIEHQNVGCAAKNTFGTGHRRVRFFARASDRLNEGRALAQGPPRR
jgi:hypothetical protein